MPSGLGDLLKSRMGNMGSKRKDKAGRSSAKDRERGFNGSTNSSTDIFNKWSDDSELRTMRRTIEHNPEIFILNNLMMTIQFFENFEEEIANIKSTSISTKERDLNLCLPTQKHVLIPDVLQEHISKKVNFTYERHDIFCVEPLQPIRIFIVFDNIEVTDQNFASPYSSINETITYSMQLKQSKHKGYVMLQRLEVNPSKKKNDRNRDEAIYSDGDSVYSRRKSNPNISIAHLDNKSDESGNSSPIDDVTVYDEHDNLYDYSSIVKNFQKGQFNKRPVFLTKSKELMQSASPAESTSSGYRSGNYALDSDSDGGYAQSAIYSSKITSENEVVVSSSEIPKDCFTYVAEDKIYGVRKEKRTRINHKERLIKGVLHSRNYGVLCLNSTKFMSHFYDFFTRELAEIMGFNSEDHEPDGSVIYREKLEILDSPIFMKDDHFAITPCIWSHWPVIADEWLERPRASWPTYDVIEKVREIGCYIIPEGYSTEKTSNDLKNLEWEIIFPAAEKYLETCMSLPQIRVYLISLVLQKTFFRPIESVVGLTGTHIRNQLFWLIEEDDKPSKWPENRTGECLLKLLTSLYKSISQDTPILPDYFVREKNLFQGKIYLLRTQKQLKRIIENPVMYVLHAMQNIRHSKKFFPKLDYGKFLKILTEDVLTLINPRLLSNNLSKSMPNLDNDYEQTGGFWDHNKQSKERQRIYSRKAITKKTLIDAETSYDQVIEIAVRCADMEPRRLCRLLDFFIRHFTEIAEYCHKYRALTQNNLYIEHAERLSVLLSEYSSEPDEAKKHLEKLEALRKRIITSKPQSDAPETPKRNSDRPIFTAPFKDRYKKSFESQETSVHLSTTSGSQEDLLDRIPVLKLDQPPEKKHVTIASVHEEKSEEQENSMLTRPVTIIKNHGSSPEETTYI